jgi:glycolate oxidase
MQKADSNLLNPRNAAEVQTLFKKAFKENIPVYVYRQAAEGGAAVSLLGLDKIIEIDAANLVATVEPGVELGSLNSALREQGLRFVPADNVFYQKKILGEFIYEGCSNLLSTKYGITKHFLMGSALVLPNGEMLNTGGKTVKNVTGYDFTRFFNGSYANLGVAVKYLLKLLPLPETRKNITVKVKDTAAAISIIKEMRQMKRQAYACPH